jgi:hypothetical protein
MTIFRIIALLAAMGLTVAIGARAEAPAAAPAPSLSDLLSAHDFQGALLPAEAMRGNGLSVLAVYRVFQAKDGDVEIVYGYAGSDHKSYYRSYALFAKAVRFELVRTPEDRTPLMPAIRDYAIDHQAQNFAVRSLLAELPLTSDRRVMTMTAGPCAAPFGIWFSIKDPVDHPIAERMVLHVLDSPAPFLPASGCALSLPKSAAPIHVRARAVYFAQGLPLGDGGFLAISSSDPLAVRFDGALKAPFLENGGSYLGVDYSADQQKQLEKTALDQTKTPGALPAPALYEQQLWELLQPQRVAPAVKPPAKPLKTKPGG